MQNFSKHPILLTFRDKNLEQRFRKDNDRNLINFYRLGIGLSIVIWLTMTLLISLLFPEVYKINAALIIGLLIPTFTLTFISTFYERFTGYYQFLMAICNFLAAMVMIYQSVLSTGNYQMLTLGMIGMVVFAFFLLRIRFKWALLVTFSYALIAQAVILIANNYTSEELWIAQMGIWFGMLSCSLGGYYLEQSIRTSYVQGIIIDQQQRDLEKEQERSERLLLNVLPEEICERLKLDTGQIIADRFDSISVLFADIVGFTALSSQLPAHEVVSFLNDLFIRYDDLVEKYNLEKIKTIGDAYMVAGGIPVPDQSHAVKVVDFAFDMMKETEKFNRKNEKDVRIRVGIHSGPAVAGIIGKKKFLYDLWGDTVNTASRMESSGVAGKIQLTYSTYSLVKDHYTFENRGEIHVKGKGNINSYFVESKLS